MEKRSKDSLFEDYSDRDIQTRLTIFDLSDDPVELTNAMCSNRPRLYTQEEIETYKKQTYLRKRDTSWHDERVRFLLFFAEGNGYDNFYSRLHDLIIDDVKHFPITASTLMSQRDGLLYSV